VQSNSFSVGKKCVYVEEYEGFSSEQSTSIPNGDVLWLLLSLNDHHTSPCGNMTVVTSFILQKNR